MKWIPNFQECRVQTAQWEGRAMNEQPSPKAEGRQIKRGERTERELRRTSKEVDPDREEFQTSIHATHFPSVHATVQFKITVRCTESALLIHSKEL